MIDPGKIILGDCIQSMKNMEAGSVHVCMTSPPYFALRDYKVAGQIGLESTMDEYLAKMVAVFSEVRRVLRNDGVLWLNIGDSMAGGGPHHGTNNLGKSATNKGCAGAKDRKVGIANGNKLGVPERLVLALQAAGWIWRATVQWCKLAPMPESCSGTRWERCRVHVSKANGTHQVKLADLGQRKAASLKDCRTEAGLILSQQDRATWSPCPGCPKCIPNNGLVLRRGSWRPTRSHEAVYMLVKGPGYYADQEAVRTALADATVSRDAYSRIVDDEDEQYAVAHDHETVSTSGANMRDVLRLGPEPNRWVCCQNLDCLRVWGDGPRHRKCPACGGKPSGHYAAFPTKLVEPFLKASTSAKGACAACGAQWARVVEIGYEFLQETNNTTKHHDVHGWDSEKWPRASSANKTLGWRPTCKCNAAVVPPTAFDPFAGTGTVGVVARRLGLDFIGCELSPHYAAIARKRIETALQSERLPAMSAEYEEAGLYLFHED